MMTHNAYAKQKRPGGQPRARRIIFACLIAACLAGACMAGGGAARAQNSAFDDPGKSVGGGKAGGDIVPSSPNVDGGSISVGATAQIVVLFRNDNSQPITTGPIQLYPGSTVSAAVALNQCAQEPLPPGGSCAVSVSVKALSAGDWRVEMLMRHSGRSRLVTATIAGKVEESQNQKDNFTSDVEAIPNEIKFGTVNSGQPVVKGIVMRNTTSEALDINSIYIEAAEQSGFSLKTDCDKLAPGQACIVTVTWSPVMAGTSSGVLLVEHSGPTSVASVPLDGTYAPTATDKADTFPKAVPGKGLLVSSQETVDFGSSIQTTSAITVSLVNVGDAPIRLKDLKLSSSDNGLSIAKNGCKPGLMLQPVDACALTVSWSPVRTGPIIDDVQVTHDGARGVMVLPIKGTATGVISQDSKALRLSSAPVVTSAEPDTIIANGVSAPNPNKRAAGRSGANNDSAGNSANALGGQRDSGVDPASVLDGFIVSSHSPTRAIITGPGGSRIVYNGQKVVVGGFLWNATVRPSGVEMVSGPEKVLLLFDRSLSSVKNSTGQSGSTGSTGTSSSTTPATAASSPATK